MARSNYIYLVGKGDDVLAAFTVKREAYEWIVRSLFKPSQLNLSRMKDNPSDSRACGTREMLALSREDLVRAYRDKHKMPHAAVMSLGNLMQFSLDGLEDALLAYKPDVEFIAHAGRGCL